VTQGHGRTAGWTLDSQTFTALGAACVDHSTAATGFHANQETVGTGATCFGWLVGAFHNSSFVPNAMKLRWTKPKIIANFLACGKSSLFWAFGNTRIQIRRMWFMMAVQLLLRLWISS